MTTHPPPRSTLLHAYRSADYRVGDDLSLQLVIDRPEPLLDALLRRWGTNCAALLTAANPASELRTAPENDLAMTQLQQRLAQCSITFLPACGRDPQGAWPDEPGVLALGITQQEATKVAADFGQLALVWCEISRPPRLVWVTEP